MPKGKSKYFPLLSILINIILLFNAFMTANYMVFQGKFPQPLFYYQLFIGWVLIWIVVAINMKLYDMPRVLYLDKIILKSIYAVTIFVLVSALLLFFITNYKFSRLFFALAITLFSIMLIFWNLMLVILFKVYRRRGHNYRTIAVVGFNDQVEKFMNEVLLIPEYGYIISGIFGTNRPPEKLSAFYKGTEEGLILFLENNKVDELLISLPKEKSDLMNDYMSYADNHLIRVTIIPNFSGYLYQKFAIDYVRNIPVLQLRKEPLESVSSRMMKRVFDIIFATLVIVFIASWLFPILAMIIKLTSKGPVFFSQMRSGKDGNSFKCLKFRSMTVNSLADSMQATKNDARVTTIGKFIRKTSLDEFPQFFNVLANNMSVVGPRPHMLKHTENYQKSVDKYMVRHYAKPGITGLAQVRGFRGEIKEPKDIEKRAEADIWYIENWNILLDLKIILRTVLQVVFKKEENAF